MARIIGVPESSKREERLWPRSFAFFGAQIVFSLLATGAAGATAYYSLTGSFTDGTETQSVLFATSSGIRSNEAFSLRTWQYAGTGIGGANAAGDEIAAGGFDSILRLYGGETLIALDDDINRSASNYDAELTWGSAAYRPPEVPLPDPLRSGAYRLDLKALNGSLGGSDGAWAVDVIAPADKLTVTGVAYNGLTNIQSLKFGSSDILSTANVDIGDGQALAMSGRLVVGKSGRGDLEVHGGAISSGDAWLGYDSGSLGVVVLENSSLWFADSIQLGRFGDAGLLVDSQSQATFFDDAFLAYYSTSNSTVTVNGLGASLTVQGDLEVGDGGYGGLHINDQGQVDSRVSGANGRDVIGDDATARGEVTVSGPGALWQTDRLIVGNNGTGTISITNGGKVATTGNAYLGYNGGADHSSVTLTGIAPDSTLATWQISGDLHIGGNEAGPSFADQTHLTINTGGLVDVAGTTTYWDAGGWLDLHGGTLRTGALVKGCGAFDWTNGTLELTNSGLTLDSITPDGIFGSDLTIGAGKSLLLSSPHPDDQLVIGDTGLGHLRVESGGTVVSKSKVYVGKEQNYPDNSSLVVSGLGSTFAALAPMYIGPSHGEGIMDVQLGGHVKSYGDVKVGEGIGVGQVDIHGASSRWDITGDIEIGQGYLNVFDQAAVTSGNATISSGAGATTGSALVDGYAIGLGVPARWDVSGNMSIVNETSGLGVIRNGRVTVTGDFVLGPTGPGSAGTSLAVRSGGQVEIGGTLSFGTMANLELSGDSRIRTGSFTKTGSDGSFNWTGGTLHITDQTVWIDTVVGHSVFGSTLTIGAGRKLVVDAMNQIDALSVASNATGSLTIEGGGIVESRRGAIGVAAVASGSVLVSGSGSQWNISTDLRVADSGEGMLTILGGGAVSVAGPIAMAVFGGADGIVLVSGSSSLLDSNALYVGGWSGGAGGTGSLTVQNGGTLSASDMLKIWNAGVVSVSGGGTQLIAGEISLEAGASFNTSGGTVVRANRLTGFGDVTRFRGNLQLGHSGGSGEGWHTVGLGQTLTVDQYLVVGLDRRADLNVEAGGRLESGRAFVATSEPAGLSNISINGGRWIASDSVFVGGTDNASGATGAVRVYDGGLLRASGSVKVWPHGLLQLTAGSIINAAAVELAGGSFSGEGTLALAGPLSNAGYAWLSGPLSVSGIGSSYLQATAGTLTIEIGGATPGDYGRLNVVGSAALDGVLRLMFVPTGGGGLFVPAAGDSFDIFDWGSRSGTFGSVSLPTLAPGLMWNAAQLYTTGVLSVLLAGDYNGNGVVDAADYTVWRDSLGQIGVGLAANGDNTGASAGVIDLADYLVWKSHFGQVAGSGAAALLHDIGNHPVPEPGASLLLSAAITIGAATSLRYMKRRVIS